MMIDLLAANGGLPTTEVGVAVIIAVLILKEVIPVLRRNGRNGGNSSSRHIAIITAILESNKEIVTELHKLRTIFKQRPCVMRDLQRNEKQPSSKGD